MENLKWDETIAQNWIRIHFVRQKENGFWNITSRIKTRGNDIQRQSKSEIIKEISTLVLENETINGKRTVHTSM